MKRLDFAPTPLTFLYTDANGNDIFLKREDLLPYCFGGNKVRIGLCYLEDMKRRGFTHMVAYGNARSNLCRVLSNLCASEKIPITVIQPSDDDGTRHESFNGKLCREFGAKAIPCSKLNVAETVQSVLDSITASGEKPYYIYGDCTGRGNLSVPVRAYPEVYKEISVQLKQLNIHTDMLVLAAGTGMTQAGLLCGQLLSGEKSPPLILGISVARSKDNATVHIAEYVNAWLKENRPELKLPADQIHICDRFALQYGISDRQMLQTIQEMMCRYGVPMDATYTGKAYSGLLRLIQDQKICNKNIVFIHTGGTPLYFDGIQ